VSAPTQRRHDRGLLRVTGLAILVSLVSFLYCFQRGEILLYGDAVAHINIARRVFDSQTPGLLQLGTVWLPLPHLLMVPFLLSDWMWQTGVGGSIPSMIGYVFGVAGIFRLVRGTLETDARSERAGAWVAAFAYGTNPNLLYLQTTAMTESLYLALFVWAVVYLCEFVRGGGGEGSGGRKATKDTRGGFINASQFERRVPQGLKPAFSRALNGTAEAVPCPKPTYETNSRKYEGKHGVLWKCGLCLAGAELTRYDGWVLAAAMGVAVVGFAVRRREDRSFRRCALKFVAGVAAVPLLWLAYNAAVYGNPLEFANGPYSAKAIEQRTATVNPAANHVGVAASYFLKSAQLDMADGNWGRIWIVMALAGLVLTMMHIRARWVLLALWFPLLFYALSIAYGSVPLFVPAWWPFTWYNLRYGLQLLPLFAVAAGMIPSALTAGKFDRAGAAPEVDSQDERLARSLKRQPDANPHPSAATRHKETNLASPAVWAAAAVIVVTALSYFSVLKAQPLCFKEAWVNSRARLALETAVAERLSTLPRNSEYLMYLGEHVGVFQQAAVPLRQVVNEGNHRPWKKPADAEGLWERALADPARHVNFAIAFEGDAVDRAVDKRGLTLLLEIHTTGQPRARIYATRVALNQSR
jgi:hypothetical protein